ncbi:MAG: hypothetical protein GX349_08195 [Firmicutes bacterium]|nr:hypothetical protein [Bacillota bacterium]
MKIKRQGIYALILAGLLLPLLFGGCGGDKQDPPKAGEEFVIPADAFALENLQGEDLEDRFSLTESLTQLEQLREILISFRELTEECRGKISPETLREVGNTGWEMQHLGFHNLPNTLEGTLRLQDYEIKKLEFTLAKEQYEKGEITLADVEEAQAAFLAVREGMQEFLKAYTIAD